MCHHLIKVIDFSVVYGYRPESIQTALFYKGRKKKDGYPGTKRSDFIIVDKSRVVTYRGLDKPSEHNYLPSRAVDIIPYPSGWSRPEKIYELAGAAKATVARLKEEGKVSKEFTFGSDWQNPPDPNHIQVR